MRTPASPRFVSLAVLAALTTLAHGVTPSLAAQTPQPRPQSPDSAAAPPAAKAATFHLPAGDYTIQQLLEQAGQALRRPIALPDALPADAGPLRLQCDLALPQQAWEEVLGALLSTRGLVLVRDAAGTGHEALPTPSGMASWIGERATEMTPRELLERRGFAGPVRVLAKTTTEPAMLTNALRPHLAMGPRAVTFEAADGGIRFVGLARPVRFALQLVIAQAPDLMATMPATVRPWPRAAAPGVHRLEPGRYTPMQLLDRLAAAQRSNLIAGADVAGDAESIDVAAAIEGDELRFEEQLTTLLWTRRVLVLEVSAEHRLGEALRFETPVWPHATRMQNVSPEELLARPGLVAWVTTTFSGGPLTQNEVIAVFRGFAAGGPAANTLAIGTFGHGYLASGHATQVIELLQRIEAKKAGK